MQEKPPQSSVKSFPVKRELRSVRKNGSDSGYRGQQYSGAGEAGCSGLEAVAVKEDKKAPAAAGDWEDKMIKVAVLVSGGGTNLQAIIDAVAAGTITNAELAVVISNNADAYALERAKKAGIDAVCISPKDYDDREQFHTALIRELDQRQIDLVVLAGYLVIIPKELVSRYKNRIINIHPSLIPSFCGTGFYGLKVHEGVLARGNKVTGATVHFVDEGTDTGPIILQKAVEVMEDDTPKSLQLRVMEQAEWQILPKAIDLIANDRLEIVGHLVKRK